MTGYPYISLMRRDGYGGRQLIQPGEYTTVRFHPEFSVLSDADGMHDYAGTQWADEDASGLIWPSVSGVGILDANIHWRAADYTELRDRFVRDPLGLVPDSTATDHRPPSPGMQCFTKMHMIKVDPGTPLCLKVFHNASAPVELIMGQFKLTILPD